MIQFQVKPLDVWMIFRTNWNFDLFNYFSLNNQLYEYWVIMVHVDGLVLKHLMMPPDIPS